MAALGCPLVSIMKAVPFVETCLTSHPKRVLASVAGMDWTFSGDIMDSFDQLINYIIPSNWPVVKPLWFDLARGAGLGLGWSFVCAARSTLPKSESEEATGEHDGRERKGAYHRRPRLHRLLPFS